MDIKRKPDEAYFPYKERLVVAKLEGEIDLDWSDIVELLGDGTHPDTLRKAAYGIYEAYKYRLESSLDISSQDVLEQLEAKKIEIQKERYKLFDQRNALNKIIREKMGERRYIHSVNVSQMALKLAKKYGENEEKAAIAGILHDITKEMPDEFHLKLFKENNIKLDEVEKRAKKLFLVS